MTRRWSRPKISPKCVDIQREFINSAGTPPALRVLQLQQPIKQYEYGIRRVSERFMICTMICITFIIPFHVLGGRASHSISMSAENYNISYSHDGNYIAASNQECISLVDTRKCRVIHKVVNPYEVRTFNVTPTFKLIIEREQTMF